MSAALTHEHLGVRHRFVGTLVMETGLHIGSGRGSTLTDALVVRTGNGVPYIPGSSFKGALRSSVERIAPNLGILHPPVTTCQLNEASDVECLTAKQPLRDSLKRMQELCDVAKRAGQSYRAVAGDEAASNLVNANICTQPEIDSAAFTRKLAYQFIAHRLCDTCRLFGSTLFAAKVRVGDLRIREPWVEMTEIRDGVGIDRDTETAKPKVKFDLEVVPSESAFDFCLDAENLSTRDLGLLCIGLQEFRAGLVPLGGRSSRGLGGCRLSITGIFSANLSVTAELIRYLTAADIGSRMIEQEPDAFIKNSIQSMFQEGGH